MTGRKKPESPDQDSCASCRFWREDMEPGHEGRYGDCRRSPPGVLMDAEGDVFTAPYPTRPADEWCGEHQRTCH